MEKKKEKGEKETERKSKLQNAVRIEKQGEINTNDRDLGSSIAKSK